MTTAALTESPSRVSSVSLVGWTYALGIGLSACLLFTLEPMVGLLMLPILGGAPAVWATTLAFFQLILLAGYLYAHVSVTRLGRLGPVLHIGLGVAAIAALFAAPAMADIGLTGVHPIVQVLGTLLVSVGLPAFLLCSTTPLVSAWLAAVLASRGALRGGDVSEPVATAAAAPTGDPYRLYIVSNAGSLLALLAYPFLVEPTLQLSAQQTIWRLFLVILVGLLAVLAIARLRLATPASNEGAGAPAVEAGTVAAQDGGEHISAGRVARWLFLAAVPCGLLSAVTNFITADLIAAPMLWVGPLGIYLATFVVAFSDRGRRWVGVATVMAPAMATLLWIPFRFPGLWPTLVLLALELLGFGAVALTLHGALAADRPHPSRLTMYYLVVSLGGVIGGSFVGLVAPVVFPAIWEYPILVAAAFLGMPAIRSLAGADARKPAGANARKPAGASAATTGSSHGGAGGWRALTAGAKLRLLPYLVLSVLVSIPVGFNEPLGLVVVVPLLLFGAAILTFGAQPRLMASTTALVLVAIVVFEPVAPAYRERDFFGVSEVTNRNGVHILWHGTTNHGSQWTDPARAMEPRGYYDRHGPLADVFAVADARGPQEIGIVGLGSGGMSAYERGVDHMTYFEIDPVVVKIASDPKLFTFLSRAPNRPRIVVGDARVELTKVPDSSYDLLILDAFSGDSIPTHLLTVEALRDAVRVLRPGGLLLVHISNRYYELAPAVSAGCERVGLASLSRRYDPTQAEQDAGATASEWLVAAGDPAQLTALTPKGWTATAPAQQAITDDFPDVLRFARLGNWLTGR